jgi:hypothetical protein
MPITITRSHNHRSPITDHRHKILYKYGVYSVQSPQHIDSDYGSLYEDSQVNARSFVSARRIHVIIGGHDTFQRFHYFIVALSVISTLLEARVFLRTHSDIAPPHAIATQLFRVTPTRRNIKQAKQELPLQYSTVQYSTVELT